MRGNKTEVGADPESDEPSDRIGGVVVVTPRATHEAALVAIEERRVFVGDVADVEREGEPFENASNFFEPV